MKVYVAICYDRHIDDGITVHANLESAITECQRFMGFEHYAHYGEWERERDLEGDNWLYCIAYSAGSDFPTARVEKTTLKE